MRRNDLRFNLSKMDTPVQFYEMKKVSNNGMPARPEEVLYYECWAHVESVSLKDYQNAVQTGTQHEVKAFIRDYPGINNKMMLFIGDVKHNIKKVSPNYRNSDYTIVVAEAVDRS